MKPTNTERRLMIYIQTYQRENQGLTPSLDEICAYFGWKKSTAHTNLANLESKGWIERATLRRPIVFTKSLAVSSDEMTV